MMIRLLIFFMICTAFASPERNRNQVSDFSLKSTNGSMVSMADYPDAKGFIIVFTCNHCPFAKQYPQRLNELSTRYLSQHVPLIAISSTDTVVFEEDIYPEMVKASVENKMNYPYLYDATQEVAKKFKAEKTPHAFVLWKENGGWVIKYNGAIDDNGAEPQKVTHPYVAEAVDALLKGEPIKVSETKSIGCQLKWRK
jgi:peroxiredoxin